MLVLAGRAHALYSRPLPLLPRAAHRCFAAAGGRSVDVASPSAAAALRNADPSAVFVVSGASRGLGLEFARQLLRRTAGTVVACCRTPTTSAGLQELLAASDVGRLKLVTLDLCSQESVDAAAVTIREDCGRVDMLLNVAGILHDAAHPKAPERKLADVDRNWLAKTLDVNAVGPVLLTQALEPMLRHPRGKAAAPSAARAPCVVASVSARVGSIGDNGMGGWYSYRISKAALNMATKTLALELGRSNVWAISLHPGTTDTDLSKPFQGNVKPEKLFTSAYSVASMLAVVEGLDKDHSGGFYAYDGSSIQW